ncbi:hypothetical protein BC830DRAFT_1091538 [Chytriomyces sp. MP71]|nr:hypothetical protein BC830DRAFT_1091538 [Chytriomyces sp. MP71]
MAPLGLNLDLSGQQAPASSPSRTPLFNEVVPLQRSSDLQSEQAPSPALPAPAEQASAQPPISSPAQTFVGWDGQIHSFNGQWHHFPGINSPDAFAAPSSEMTTTDIASAKNSAATFSSFSSTATAIASSPFERSTSTTSSVYSDISTTSAAENLIESINADTGVTLSTAKGVGIAALITFIVGILFCVHCSRRRSNNNVVRGNWTPPPPYRGASMDSGKDVQLTAGEDAGASMASTNSRLSVLRTYPALYELATKATTMPRTSIEDEPAPHRIQLPVQLPDIVARVNEEESLGVAIHKRLSIMPSFAETVDDDDESYLGPTYRIPRSSIFIDDSQGESLAEAINKRMSRISNFSNFSGVEDEPEVLPSHMKSPISYDWLEKTNIMF